MPDDPNWSTIQSGVRGLPLTVKLDAKRWTANRNAAEWLAGLDGAQTVLRVECGDGATPGEATPPTLETYKITVSEVLRCLYFGAGADMGNKVYLDCLWDAFGQRAEQFTRDTGLAADCQYFAEGEFKFIPDAWDPEKITERRISEALVQSPVIPFWLLGVLTVGVGGVLILGTGPGAALFIPALCTLQAGAGPACPGNPNYPPGQTPQPDGTP